MLPTRAVDQAEVRFDGLPSGAAARPGRSRIVWSVRVGAHHDAGGGAPPDRSEHLRRQIVRGDQRAVDVVQVNEPSEWQRRHREFTARQLEFLKKKDREPSLASLAESSGGPPSWNPATRAPAGVAPDVRADGEGVLRDGAESSLVRSSARP